MLYTSGTCLANGNASAAAFGTAASCFELPPRAMPRCAVRIREPMHNSAREMATACSCPSPAASSSGSSSLSGRGSSRACSSKTLRRSTFSAEETAGARPAPSLGDEEAAESSSS
eukprot:5544766-Pleurochrysis_carterae.AAC.1